MYIIGHTKESAQPVIIFSSSSRNATKGIQKSVDASCILAKYPGLSTGICDVVPSTGLATRFGDEAWESPVTNKFNGIIYRKSSSRGHLGAKLSVRADHNDSTSWKIVTGGGVVKFGDAFHYMTVAHAFTDRAEFFPEISREQFDKNAELDIRQDGSNQAESMTNEAPFRLVKLDNYYFLSQFMHTLDFWKVVVPPAATFAQMIAGYFKSIVARLLGVSPEELDSNRSLGDNPDVGNYIDKYSSTHRIQPGLDYALIRIRSPDMIPSKRGVRAIDATNNYNCDLMQPAQLEPGSIEITTIAGSSNGFSHQGTLSESPTSMMSPGSNPSSGVMDRANYWTAGVW